MICCQDSRFCPETIERLCPPLLERCVNPQCRKADAFGPPKQDMEEWLSYFRMKVVDVNRTSRGSPTGGIGRFSALVVVGNGNVSFFGIFLHP